MGEDIKKTKFKKYLTDQDFLMVEFFLKHGKIVEFCLQYDALLDTKYRTIMRIDNCHGSLPHKHVYHQIKKQTKQFVDSDPHIAFNAGQKFILVNFKKIKENFIFAS